MSLLLRSVEADLAQRQEEKELAASTEAWLMSLKERIYEVEGDSEEAVRARRQPIRLLVDGIVIEDKRKGAEPRGRITYRFYEPHKAARQRGGKLCKVSGNSDEFLEAKEAAEVEAGDEDER